MKIYFNLSVNCGLKIFFKVMSLFMTVSLTVIESHIWYTNNHKIHP